MKRLTALILALLMALSLCACGGGSDTAHVGKYNCTSIVMGGVNAGGGEEWLELKENGNAVLYISGETRNGEYTLEDGTFAMTIDGQEVAAGTLAEGVLNIDLLGATCVFEMETGEE